MAIALRGISSLGQSADATLILPRPSSVVAGDVLYAFVTSANPEHAACIGWTDIGGFSGTNANTIVVLRKVAGLSEPLSYTFTNSTQILVTGSIVALSGVDNITPEDATPTFGDNLDTTLIAPSITTVSVNAWWFAVFQSDFAITSMTLPSGFTNDVPTFGNVSALQRVDHKVVVTPGPTGTAISIGSPTSGWITASVAVRPDPTVTAPYSIALETPLGALDLETNIDRFQLEDASGVLLEEQDFDVALDRITLEDQLGVLILESSSPMFRAFLTEDARGYIYLEDGSGVLLGDPGLFYAIGEDVKTSIALVGAVGPVLIQSGPADFTPSWDAGATRVAGNLLVCSIILSPNSAVPTTPTGWTLAAQVVANTTAAYSIFYRVATGGDAAPTFISLSGTGTAVLMEFSGVASVPLDQTATAGGTTSPQVATDSTTDIGAFELIIACAGNMSHSLVTTNTSHSINNGTSINSVNNNGLTSDSYNFAWGVTTGNAAADSDSFSSTGSLGSIGIAIASFKVGPPPTRSDRIVLEDGTGVILSEEFDTQPIFRSYDLETTTDRFLLEDSSGVLISEEPTVSIGTLFTQAVTGVLSFTGSFVTHTIFGKVLPGVLSFTGTFGPNAITRGMSAGLTLVGAQVKATNKSLAVAIASFVGAFNKKTSTSRTAGISFVGAIASTKLYSWVMAGVLSFTGAFNRNTSKTFAAALSFTGPTNLLKSIARSMTAGVSFTGAFLKKTSKNISGVLSFTGVFILITAFRRALAGVLSFTGSIASSKVFLWAMAGVLTFTGAFVKKTSKGISGGITFTGASVRSVTKFITAALSFTGAFSKRTLRSLTGILSFTGTFQASKFATWVMTGALSLTGAISRKTSKTITGGITFAGSLPGRVIAKLVAGTLSLAGASKYATGKGMVAGLSFTGSVIKKTQKLLVAAVLSFTGAFVGFMGHIQNFLALSGALSFAGAITRQTNKRMAAGLSLVGTITKLVATSFAGTLTFVGRSANQMRKALAAVLSFTGTLAVRVAFMKALVAVLSFTGASSRRLIFNRVFTAALGFAGSVSTQTQRVMALAATMRGSGNLTSIRWYIGTFKEVSKGLFRAAYRGIRNIITQNRNLR